MVGEKYMLNVKLLLVVITPTLIIGQKAIEIYFNIESQRLHRTKAMQPLGLILRNCLLEVRTSPVRCDPIYTIKKERLVKKSEMSGNTMVQKTFGNVCHMFIDSYP